MGERFSDHCPIGASLNIEKAKKDNVLSLLPKLKWNPNLEKPFKESIKNAKSCFEDSQNGGFEFLYIILNFTSTHNLCYKNIIATNRLGLR